MKVAGQWKYLYRAVDRNGATVDFLLCAHRDEAAARRFLERAIDLHGVPEKITIDKSGANTAAIESIQANRGLTIELCQSKYLNRRARPPSDQATDAADACVQIVLVGCHHS